MSVAVRLFISRTQPSFRVVDWLVLVLTGLHSIQYVHITVFSSVGPAVGSYRLSSSSSSSSYVVFSRRLHVFYDLNRRCDGDGINPCTLCSGKGVACKYSKKERRYVCMHMYGTLLSPLTPLSLSFAHTKRSGQSATTAVPLPCVTTSC